MISVNTITLPHELAMIQRKEMRRAENITQKIMRSEKLFKLLSLIHDDVM